ncbi:glucose-induced degradation protein 8 homolog [Symsagittifera roscoffensis]|uniref:glucose-induced degradation protein 8 homolog n=1 Tax=Symsagittifera roscoffensis TaxID=84072 RepID=UPI00307B4BCB
MVLPGASHTHHHHHQQQATTTQQVYNQSQLQLAHHHFLTHHHNTLVHSVNILRSLPMPTAIPDSSSSSAQNISAAVAGRGTAGSALLTPLGVSSAATATCTGASSSFPPMVSTTQWERNMVSAAHHFSKQQMNDIVLDYLIKEGFKEAAEAFAAEANMDLQPDKLSGMDERLTIQTCIVSGDIIGAMKLINDLNSDLLDENAEINFQLKQQHVIELIRRGDKEGALTFAQTYLSEHGDDANKRQATEKTLMLLCFDDFDSCPVKDFLSESKRLKLAEDVNSAILIAQDREPSSKLAKAVQILDWAQNSLDDRGVKYPRIDDVTTGELSYPDSASLATMQ